MPTSAPTRAVSAAGEPLTRRPRSRRWWLHRLGPVGAALVVALVHFRPWQGPLLEDWGFALAWEATGFAGMFDILPYTLGRPFHLLPPYVGMALSDGGVVGQFLVLTAIALAQLLLAVWALRPRIEDPVLRWAAALVLALHPWWPAGDILRFLSAQAAMLWTVVWLGAALRFAAGRGRWWLLLVFAGGLVGLLSYQGPAFALLLGAALVALTAKASLRRRLWLVAATTAAVATSFAWSVLVVPMIAEGGYEATLDATDIDPAKSVAAILLTIVLRSWELVVVALVVGLLVVAVGFHRLARPAVGWLLLAALAVSPLGAMAYAASLGHLNDPERVAYPVGIAVWFVLVLALQHVRREHPLRAWAAAGLVVVSVALAATAYATWTGFAVRQQSLLAAVEDVREDVPADARLIVADLTGSYGDVYLLLPPTLDQALLQAYGPGASAELCTMDGVPRDHPGAAVYPIPTTPDCSALFAEVDEEAPVRIETVEGPLDVFLVPAAG